MGGMSRQQSYQTYTPPPTTNAAPSMGDTYDSYTAAKNEKFGKPLATRGKGMQLGKKNKTTSALDSLGGEAAEVGAPLAGVPTPAAPPVQPSVPAAPARNSAAADRESIHITVGEAISAHLTRDGALEAFEVKGDLQLRIGDPALTQLRLHLALGATRGAQLNAHPKVDKAKFKNDSVVQLQDTSKGFPANNSIQVVRWRLAGKPEEVADELPIKFTVWTSEMSAGTYSVTVEYEVSGSDSLKDVVVVIPYQTAEPSVSSFDAVYEVSGDSIDWTIGDVDASNGSGSFEFEAQAGSESEFFPMQVRFAKTRPWVDVDVGRVELVGEGAEVGFSRDVRSVGEGYVIV